MGIDTTIENEMRDRLSLDIPGQQHALAAVREFVFMYYSPTHFIYVGRP
jgi:hypothetical protein